MKQYKQIDVFKFIAAIMIIVLHANPFSSVSSVVGVLVRNVITPVAIPFFFVCSGFFYDKSATISGEKNIALKRFKATFVLYLKWSAIYFVFVLISWLKDGFTIEKLLCYIKDFIFEGSYSTIWFLNALAFGFLLLYIVRKYVRTDFGILALTACIYLFTALLSTLYGVGIKIPILSALITRYYSFFDSIKNAVLYALPFLLIGSYISKKKIEEKKSQKVVVLIGLLVSLMLYAIEVIAETKLNLNLKGVDSALTLPLVVTFGFSLLLFYNFNRISDKTCLYCRNVSILMFLTQRIFITIGQYMKINEFHSMLWFGYVFGTTLSFSTIVFILSEKFPYVRKLYK